MEGREEGPSGAPPVKKGKGMRAGTAQEADFPPARNATYTRASCPESGLAWPDKQVDWPEIDQAIWAVDLVLSCDRCWRVDPARQG